MLGEREIRWVSQSAWIKSLIATMVRSWDGRRGSSGGLFGGRSKRGGEVLGWSRAQQAAFLIYVWGGLKSAVGESQSDWAMALRALRTGTDESRVKRDDLAFYGPFSLITTDQGVRGYLQVLNDLLFESKRLKAEQMATR